VFWTQFLALAIAVSAALSLPAQDPREIVKQAVQTEMTASSNDHSHWIYFEIDRRPELTVKQWVAQAQNLSLNRVVERNGQPLSEAQQRQEMIDFINDTRAQAKQRKSGQHDDEQAAELLQMLPDAFLWTIEGERGNDLALHFTPNPAFHPPDIEGRVFAGMEGEMLIDRQQHRIATLKGRLIRDIKIGFGLLGQLDAGGTFDVERRELTPGIWQIVETHVHIQGHALIFKTISEIEDDVKSHFERIDGSTSTSQALDAVLRQNPEPGKEQIAHGH
jgi:hypothetical protein